MPSDVHLLYPCPGDGGAWVSQTTPTKSLPTHHWIAGMSSSKTGKAWEGGTEPRALMNSLLEVEKTCTKRRMHDCEDMITTHKLRLQAMQSHPRDQIALLYFIYNTLIQR